MLRASDVAFRSLDQRWGGETGIGYDCNAGDGAMAKRTRIIYFVTIETHVHQAHPSYHVANW